jgi:hypothetical protein
VNPVYRIKVEHRPNDIAEWYASAYRLSDDTYMLGSGNYADSSEEAVTKVRDWIALEATRKDGFEVYTDESGEIVSAHSVRA